MTAQWIITGAGPDKPGIVAGLTELLFNTGFNIDDSSMTILAQEFAMILLVSGDESNLKQLESGLKQLERVLSLSLSIKPTQKCDRPASQVSGQPYILSVSGLDHMGITYRVSQILANHHINITDLNAQCIEGESQPVYVMMIEILLPEAAATGPSDALRADLSELAQSEVLDIRFLPVNSATF